MKKFTLFLLAITLFTGYTLTSQVSINTDGSDPDNSAILDLKSTDKGLLLPRMNTLQISGISNPAAGLLVFNTDSSDFYGFNGNEWVSVWNTGDTLADFYCGNPITDSRDGHSYETVQIGTQCWMAENLNIGTMINSTSGGTNSDGEQTDNSTIEKYCYNNNASNCDTYGGMYQWDEMMQYVTTEGAQGICPDGWYLPTDTEWTTLTDYLGGLSVAGGKMKEAGYVHWLSPNTGATNSSGFTGLPGGTGGSSGSFSGLGAGGGWWSSSEDSGTSAWSYGLGYGDGQVGRYYDGKALGFSARCLKN